MSHLFINMVKNRKDIIPSNPFHIRVHLDHFLPILIWQFKYGVLHIGPSLYSDEWQI